MSAESDVAKVVWQREVDQVLSEGRFLGDIGIANWAFPALAAVEKVERLAALGVPILGGDVLRVTSLGATLGNESWSCERRHGESSRAFVTRSALEARRSIEAFSTSDRTLLFALVPG